MPSQVLSQPGLPGWLSGKTLDNRAGGRGIAPRSS